MTHNAIMLQPQALPALMEYAAALVQSGFLPAAIKTPQQAVAIISLGYELGLSPWSSINGINVIQGKPTISPALMLGLINRSGLLENMRIEADNAQATVTMKRVNREAHTETFTIEDAKLLKTSEYVDGVKKSISLSEKSNWKQQPRVMLKWRAVAACARVVFPDVLAGLYTTEEIAPDDTFVSDEGEITYTAPQLPALAQTVTQPQAYKHGDRLDVVLSSVEIKQGENKPYMVFTAQGKTFKIYAFSRNLFRNAGYTECEEWGAVGYTATTPPIQATIEYSVVETEDGEIKTFWEIADVVFLKVKSA